MLMDAKACKRKGGTWNPTSRVCMDLAVKKGKCVFLMLENVGDYHACWEVQNIFNTKRKANADLEGCRDREGYLDDNKYWVKKMCVK